MLAYLYKSSEDWQLCAADAAVFKVLGLLGKAEQGVSLEEILENTGLQQKALEWQYTKAFREKWTRAGQTDALQNRGLRHC